MAKKGVSRITGNTSPKTGEKALYKVTEWYPNTPANERKESLVTWELFRKRADGKFTSTNIKKKVGEFTFGKDAWQYTYRVEGYLDRPEGKDPMSIIVQPQKNEQQPSAEKNILDVKLTFQDGTPVNKKLSYQDRLWAIAKCKGMEGEHIIFTLWEDDEKGDGHNKKNQSIVKSPPVLVDSQGNARWNFALLSTYIAIANQREDDKKQHEYYITAEYNGKLKASDNANANNPEYKAPPAPPKKPAGGTNGTSQPKPAPPKPQPNSPKGSTRPHSPNNQPDKKGVITLVKLTDKNGKEFTKNPKFGETIIVHIESKNLKDKKYTLNIWEHDTIGKDDLLYSHEHTFLGDKINLSMPLTAAMQKTGEIGNDPKNPDSGEYWKGGQQEIFAEVIYIDISAKSKIIDVGIIETPKPQNNGKTATGVKNEPKPDAKSGGCPNCEKDITLEQIKSICVSKKNKNGVEICLVQDDSLIKAALPFLNSYRKKADINTCITKAHFIAQICQETKFYDLQEAFRYKNPERMRSLFYSYFKQFGSLEKQNAEAKRLSDLSLDSKNWKTVANAIYGKTHPNGKNNTDKDDGWRYSGKGFKQVTWRDNYLNLQKTAKNIFGKSVTWLDGNNPYKLVNSSEDSMLSALAFWKRGNISSKATEISDKAVTNVTALVNPALLGLDERKRYFKKAVEILQVDKCKPKGKINNSNEDGTVVVVSGTDTKVESDAFKPKEYSWVMYKTSVYKNMSLSTYNNLEKSNKLPEADYVTYLSRDTHQTSTSKGKILKHSDKRFGTYNEIPPGEYYLVPGVSGQKYKIYVIDSENKSAAAENGIDGPDGSRGGVALHHYTPRFSVGCFTFNSGNDTTPVQKLIDNLSDLPINDKKPVRFIVKERKVKESTWNNSDFGTKKWTGT
ncbi:hypothetical protein QWZ06_18705 [Chryseobacterium tructae]|uniref:Glycoside hydrolase family 19 protein n=1 Tax=Chryseobacterium tructae TaxID=1037380 RepID=A0ABV7Y436_9FLAO|nr:hypothetical protein [Chryseobacterium tructae]MDN3694159.1 hypothetical protein [Chryseobacterium tructae]